MVRRAILMLTLLSMAVPMFAKEAIIPISAVAGGANGTLFRTDVRLFNPSATKDITIQAQFLPSGTDNTAVQPRTITIVKRQMSVMNNIVSSFFAASGTGAIDLKSDDDFVVTSRTYTDSPNAAAPGTFGQFIAAYDPSAALTHGVLLHLANSSDLTQGFRTNTGFMNVNTTPVTVTLGLYASDSTLVKAATFGPIPPRSVLQQGLAGILGVNPLDFPDGYVTFSATAPVLGYSSVVDNRSSDQIFVPAQLDSGANVTPPNNEPGTVVVNVGPGISFSPSSVNVKVGDTVKFVFFGLHTSTSDLSSGTDVWNSGTKNSGDTFSHTFAHAGDFKFYCQIHSSPGGNVMNGVVHVADERDPGTGPIY